MPPAFSSDTDMVSEFAAASQQIASKLAPTASGQNQKRIGEPAIPRLVGNLHC
jgi:hypothetical protein